MSHKKNKIARNELINLARNGKDLYENLNTKGEKRMISIWKDIIIIR